MKKIVGLIFIVIISTPFFLHLVVKKDLDQKILLTENRRVTPRPELDFHKKKIAQTFTEYGRYVTDRLWGKDTITTWVNSIFKHPDYFLNLDFSNGTVGNQGYSFLGNKHSNVIDRHFRTFPLDKWLPRAEMFTRKQIALSEAAQKVHSEYLLFVAPDKHSLYFENFPDWLKNHSDVRTVTERFASLLKKQIPQLKIIYPIDELMSVKKSHQIYYKVDTHWNIKGAETGFLSILHAFGLPTIQPLSPLKKIEKKASGDLINIIGLPKETLPNENVYQYSEEMSKVVIWEDGDKKPEEKALTSIVIRGAVKNFSGRSINRNAKNKSKVLLICDSFGTALAPFFIEYFEQVYFVSNHNDPENLVNKVTSYKPEYIVFETVERNFIIK